MWLLFGRGMAWGYRSQSKSRFPAESWMGRVGNVPNPGSGFAGSKAKMQRYVEFCEYLLGYIR